MDGAGLVALSVALQAVLHYFSHKLEMRACYLMLDDKRISIGERMKYMPMATSTTAAWAT